MKLKMQHNFERFYAEISEIGGVYRVTIPKKLLEGAGWKTGDELKIMAQKKEVNNE